MAVRLFLQVVKDGRAVYRCSRHRGVGRPTLGTNPEFTIAIRDSALTMDDLNYCIYPTRVVLSPELLATVKTAMVATGLLQNMLQIR